MQNGTRTVTTRQHGALLFKLIERIDNDSEVQTHCDYALAKLSKGGDNRLMRLQLKQWAFDYKASKIDVDGILAEARILKNS